MLIRARSMNTTSPPSRQWFRQALGGPRRAAACLVVGTLLAAFAAALTSLGRSAQHPRRWFDAYEGSGSERSIATSVSVESDKGRRLLHWDRTSLWDSVRLQRMRPEDWAEWDRQSRSPATPHPALPRWAVSPADGSDVGLVETVAYGWPLRVLRVRGRLIVADDDYTAVTRKEADGLGTFENPWVARPAWGVAWIPIWPALLLSGGMFGSALWVLLTGAISVRLWARARSGRCIHCGYDLKNTGANPAIAWRCPECGRDKPSA